MIPESLLRLLPHGGDFELVEHIDRLDSATNQRQGNASIVGIVRILRRNYFPKIISCSDHLLFSDIAGFV